MPHLALILLCLFSAGASVHSIGTVYKVPSIYTPVTSGSNFLQLNPQSASPSWEPSAQSFSPLNFAPFYPTPSPLSPPSSLILVYYRAKQQAQVPSTTPITPPVPSPLAYVCKGQGITAHPSDCYKFVSCRLSPNQQVFYYEVRSCPQGLAYDSSLESCNYQSRVTNCALSKSPSRRPTATKSPYPTQTKLTYHNDLLPESTNELDKPESVSGEEGSSSPSLYMLDLPQPLLDSDETRKQESFDQAAPATSPSSLIVTAKGEKLECNCEKTKAESPSTPAVKKTTTTLKSPTTRKVNPKSTKGAKPSGNNNSGTKSPVPSTKSAEPSRKQPRVETFSIGDSSESAKMVLAKDEADEESTVNTNPVPDQTAAEVSPDKLVAGVSYEEGDNKPEGNDNGDSDDSYSSTV